MFWVGIFSIHPVILDFQILSNYSSSYLYLRTIDHHRSRWINISKRLTKYQPFQEQSCYSYELLCKTITLLSDGLVAPLQHLLQGDLSTLSQHSSETYWSVTVSQSNPFTTMLQVHTRSRDKSISLSRDIVLYLRTLRSVTRIIFMI